MANHSSIVFDQWKLRIIPKMRSSTILFVLSAIAFATATITEEQKAKALEHVRTCRTESGFSEEALRKLKAGDVGDNSPEAKVSQNSILVWIHFVFNFDKHKFQTFAKCFLKLLGFINETDNFVAAVATEKLTAYLGDKAKAEELVKDCQEASKDADKDSLALAIYKCFVLHKSMNQ